MTQPRKFPRTWTIAQYQARQRRVIEMLAMARGATEIAEEMGINVRGARKLMAKALKAQRDELQSAGAWENAAAQWWLWHERLMRAWLPAAVGGDDKKGDLVLKLMVMYADMWGLRAPQRDQQQIPGAVAGATPDVLRTVSPQLVENVLMSLAETAARMAPPAVVDGELIDTADEETPQPPDLDPEGEQADDEHDTANEH